MKRGAVGIRAQVAIEYIILIGVLLVFLIPTVQYSLQQASFQVKYTQIDSAVRRLSKAADAVHAIGPGAQEVAVITLPTGVQSFIIHDHTIGIEAPIAGQPNEISMYTTGIVSGTLPTNPGTYRVLISTLENQTVSVTLRTS